MWNRTSLLTRELLFKSGKGRLSQRTFPHIQNQFAGRDGGKNEKEGLFLLTQLKQLIIVAEKARVRLDVWLLLNGPDVWERGAIYFHDPVTRHRGGSGIVLHWSGVGLRSTAQISILRNLVMITDNKFYVAYKGRMF